LTDPSLSVFVKFIKPLICFWRFSISYFFISKYFFHPFCCANTFYRCADRAITMQILMTGSANPMDLKALFESEFDRHINCVNQTRTSLSGPFIQWVEMARTCLKQNGKIFFFGNGGSASDAQHLATELTVRYKINRPAMAALALNTDTSALTAIGNDFGYDDVFSRQIEALCRPEDLVIGITTSGTSPNVIKALEKAKEIGAKTIGLGGRDGGKLPALCDLAVIVPDNETARIQEMHITLGHAFCQALEDDCAPNL
jgi:D-sedoheptulose 7-phosphate isomerase